MKAAPARLLWSSSTVLEPLLTEALLLVHNTLVGTNLREHIAIGAAGKITSAFNIARTLALGGRLV